MRKNIMVIFAAAATMMSAPALAEVESGARVEVLAGYSEVSLDWTDFELGTQSDGGFAYGVGAGYDFAISSNAAIGVDLEYSDSNAKFVYNARPNFLEISAGRDLYVGARATFSVSKSLNLYAKAGYTRGLIELLSSNVLETLPESGGIDGGRAGVGAQLGSGKLYGFAEYAYTNYEGNFSRSQAMVGLGIRF
jgi:outer membrane immunogenic protein